MNRCGLSLVLAVVLLCICLSPAIGAARNTEDNVRCLKLEARIDEIRLRQRMGYTAKQGRLYKQKLSTLEAEHRARCR
ncbi:MAG: hypothetical protein WAU48_15165 [Gammaproteobacteria bacterium]